MKQRKKLLFGNWKMNFTVAQAAAFAKKLAAKPIPEGVEVCIFPHMLAISEIATTVRKTGLKVGAQNAYFQDEGAFTGEISMPMLKNIANYVLVGHSERRHVFGETNEQTRLKVAAAIRVGITPVLCIGETLVERQQMHTKQVLTDQLLTGLSNLTDEEASNVIIAYEPVWAISQGKDFTNHKSATPEDAETAQAIIRKNLKEMYGEECAEQVRVLYGGSAKADNTVAFLKTNGIDGLLPGGASLSVSTFWPMVENASKLVTDSAKVS